MTYTRPQVEDAANLFKALGDSTRLSILIYLLDGQQSVNEIADYLQMTQSAVSHQLKILKLNRLIDRVKDGKYVYYYLIDHHVTDILKTTLEHVKE